MRLNEDSLDIKDVLCYALGGDVPEKFLDHLVEKNASWDEEFKGKLDEYAYEFCPELAIWELDIDRQGQLEEKRLPLIDMSEMDGKKFQPLNMQF